MSSYQKFSKNIGIIGLTNLFIFLEGIILLPIITKVLGAKIYGVWTQLTVTLCLITPLVLLGLPGALIRFLASAKDNKEIQEGVYSASALILAIALIIALILILFSTPIASFFQSPPVLIKILAFIILFECLNIVFLSVFQILQRIARYSSFIVFKTLGEIGLVSGIVLFGYGLYGAVMSLLVIRILVFLMLFWSVFKIIGMKIPTLSPIKEYLIFSLPTLVSSISYWIVTASDRYLIGYFLGALFVGYYAPAYAIGNIINFFIYPFAFMLPIVLPKFFDDNKIQEVKTYLKYSLKYFLMITIPSVFGLSILSKQLLIIFTTKEIASNSYFVTPFVALSILLYGVCAIFTQILLLLQKTKVFGTIWTFAALLNIFLNFIFIPFLGILGAAITTLLAYLLAFLLILYYSFKEFSFEIDWFFIIKSVLASLLMTIFIFWFNPTGLSKTVMAVILGAVIYGVLIFLLNGFKRKEIEIIKNIFRRANLISPL